MQLDELKVRKQELRTKLIQTFYYLVKTRNFTCSKRELVKSSDVVEISLSDLLILGRHRSCYQKLSPRNQESSSSMPSKIESPTVYWS